MGKDSKRSKRVDSEIGSASDDEIETDFTFNKRLKQADDQSGSGSDAESDDNGGSRTEEEEDEEDEGSDAEEEEDEGSDAEEEEDEGSDEEEAEDQRKDAEMEELEKEYLNLRNEEQNLLKNLTRHKDEDALKGQAVKNQKALWDKSLELRFLLQKTFASSNRLPKEPFRSTFCGSDTAVNQAYTDLIQSSKQTLNCMLELQEALLEKNPSVTRSTNADSKKSDKDEYFLKDLKGELDEEWLRIYRLHCRIAPFRNSEVDKWQRKTQVTTGAAAFRGKLHAFNQKISDQVNSYMRDPSRMIKRMQLRRSSVDIFGKVPEEADKKNEEENVDGDPELLDDSEFYQQLLKEFFESCDLASSEATFYALRKLQPKKRKVVDRRASKSRKIRYHVHEKIVNFMPPMPMVLPPMAPKLFENLFGAGNRNPASVL
ncbi:putative uncharacterized protein DDB_G0270496 isoform X1 [Ananas comosus]|uniref:Protein AATF n=1 Tax=Ananas comosus TaxID=4615 RepID=A0A6P5GV14_ANACO|nr:putative uncharacterized protein DDB_G0270496 isoform X1 [Ananas comosus]XP_020111730.1 putative uncharacterized protein DDB_G0270496 isoform X1 [Ananas comosus]XP_020111731.1 putative uncharacterized protein DDB_G0270496 isoform X1 [Ananas comosus]XP_020111733.1 putative uncharacterized protein DDB_G0270496 isoform X1 [Ananas comosus]XP_020111734.1 putative uncharacterized protein DDB_G0270496 isoform X1 [Ananas comosus]